MPDGDGPSRSTRFKPGRSGNPKGRPKRGSQSDTGSAFGELLGRHFPVRIDGYERQLTADEALVHRTYQDALAGDRMAIRTILNLIVEREATCTSSTRAPVKVVCLHPDPANIDHAMIILKIATQPEGRVRANGRPYLELEPWAVQKALIRRNYHLPERALKDLKENTRDPDSVVWPGGADQ